MLPGTLPLIKPQYCQFLVISNSNTAHINSLMITNIGHIPVKKSLSIHDSIVFRQYFHSSPGSEHFLLYTHNKYRIFYLPETLFLKKKNKQKIVITTKRKRYTYVYLGTMAFLHLYPTVNFCCFFFNFFF